VDAQGSGRESIAEIAAHSYSCRMRGVTSALLAVLCLAATSARAGTANCTSTYNAAERASVASVLRARYGNDFKLIDLDRPSFVDLVGDGDDIVETSTGKSRVDLGSVAWLGFGRYTKFEAQAARIPKDIIVAFDRCSGMAVGFRVLR
jgi:hypothetical protein